MPPIPKELKQITYSGPLPPSWAFQDKSKIDAKPPDVSYLTPSKEEEAADLDFSIVEDTKRYKLEFADKTKIKVIQKISKVNNMASYEMEVESDIDKDGTADSIKISYTKVKDELRLSKQSIHLSKSDTRAVASLRKPEDRSFPGYLLPGAAVESTDLISLTLGKFLTNNGVEYTETDLKNDIERHSKQK